MKFSLADISACRAGAAAASAPASPPVAVALTGLAAKPRSRLFQRFAEAEASGFQEPALAIAGPSRQGAEFPDLLAAPIILTDSSDSDGDMD